jgi:hypothetical protein
MMPEKEGARRAVSSPSGADALACWRRPEAGKISVNGPWHDCCIRLHDMTAPTPHSELEISEDMRYQRRTWLVERVGWSILGAVLIAALLGVFGGGGVVASTERTTEGGGLSMQYDRFWRLDSPMRLRVTARPSVESDSLRISLSRDYVESLSLTTITPQPDRVETAGDRYVFEFPLTDSAARAIIVFDVEPREPGRLRGEIGIEGGESLSFSQLIYP